jgi:CelD/BcsL family acetyltransferase involved in cellulose biosynthesis
MMEVTQADGTTPWDELVRQSPQGTPFHLSGALSVAAEHAGGRLHRLVGYEDGEPAGLFPLYEFTRGPVTAVLSPPPGQKVSYCGPALLIDDRSLAAVERRHQAFVDGCLSWLDRELSPEYVHVRTAPGYDDLRALTGHGFDAELRHTYVVDLTHGTEQLLREFSSDARRNVRDGPPPGYELAEGDERALGRIVEQVRERHQELGIECPLTAEFVGALRRELPPGTMRAYVCRHEGELATGRLTLEANGTIYGWLGGVKSSHDAPVTDLVDWHIMRTAVERGLSAYDLVGANNPRISEYKAKFAPRLVRYYQLERGSRPARLAARLYSRLPVKR